MSNVTELFPNKKKVPTDNPLQDAYEKTRELTDRHGEILNFIVTRYNVFFSLPLDEPVLGLMLVDKPTIYLDRGVAIELDHRPADQSTPPAIMDNLFVFKTTVRDSMEFLPEPLHRAMEFIEVLVVLLVSTQGYRITEFDRGSESFTVWVETDAYPRTMLKLSVTQAEEASLA